MNETTHILTDNIAEKESVFFISDENLPINHHNVNNVHAFDLSRSIDPAKEVLNAAKKTLDNALSLCKDNPGLLFTDDVKNAIKTIKLDDVLWAEYRVRLKQEKPSGIKLSDITDAKEGKDNNNPGNDSVASELIKLVTTQGGLFYDDQVDKAFVSIDMNGVIHTFEIGSKAFIEWLCFVYYNNTRSDNKNGRSANESAIKQAGFALTGIAKYEGACERVHLRVADYNNGHYLFINDSDLQVIEILPTGWRIIKNSPVKFWAPGSMKSLPIPQQNGNLSQIWEFLNIQENDRLLVLAWMLESFRAETPKPILALCATQGSAKSATHDKLRQLIDNNHANLRSAPKNIEDVFVSAGCNWLVSYENISSFSQAMQDALCTLATGGGYASRTYYTNNEETIIKVKRPIIINSIPSVITAQDAVDRTISIELPSIMYREESEINSAWAIAKPSIFGGLMDLFVKTLEFIPKVELINPPRMSDFTRLGEAMAQALGNPPGTFDMLYKANRAESIGRALDDSPVATAIRNMVDAYKESSPLVFSDTMKNLLEKLNVHKQDSQAWPKYPRGLGEILRRDQRALASLNIEVKCGKPGRRGVIVEIRKT